MSIHVPPAPSHDAEPEVYERLAAYSKAEPDEKPQRDARGHRWVVVVAIVLDLLGILMLACAIAVQCAPRSGLSQAIALVSQTLFEVMSP